MPMFGPSTLYYTTAVWCCQRVIQRPEEWPNTVAECIVEAFE